MLSEVDQDPPKRIGLGHLIGENAVRRELENGGIRRNGAEPLRKTLSNEKATDIRAQLARYVREDRKIHRGKRLDSDPNIVLNRFLSAGAKDRQRLIREFLTQVDQETRSLFLQLYREARFEPFEILGDNGDPISVYGVRRGEFHQFGGGRVLKKEGDALYITNGQYKAQVELVNNGELIKYRVIPGTITRQNFIAPFIHWRTTQTDSQDRSWIDNNPDNFLDPITQPLLDKNEKTTENTPKETFNPLLGLIALAYFSPDIVDSWPKTVGLPGSGVQQTMGPAQIPVLAHIRRRDLLSSPFIQAVEDYAKSHAV